MSSTEWDGAHFFKAGDSNDVGCVEVAFHDGKIGVRDSKDHGSGPVLGFTEYEWDCFIKGAKKGEYDPPSSLLAVRVDTEHRPAHRG